MFSLMSIMIHTCSLLLAFLGNAHYQSKQYMLWVLTDPFTCKALELWWNCHYQNHSHYLCLYTGRPVYLIYCYSYLVHSLSLLTVVCFKKNSVLLYITFWFVLCLFVYMYSLKIISLLNVTASTDHECVIISQWYSVGVMRTCPFLLKLICV